MLENDVEIMNSDFEKGNKQGILIVIQFMAIAKFVGSGGNIPAGSCFVVGKLDDCRSVCFTVVNLSEGLGGADPKE